MIRLRLLTSKLNDRFQGLTQPHATLNLVQGTEARVLAAASLAAILLTLVSVAIQLVVNGSTSLDPPMIIFALLAMAAMYALSRSPAYRVGVYLGIGSALVLGVATILIYRTPTTVNMLIPPILLTGLFFRGRVVLLMTVVCTVLLFVIMLTVPGDWHEAIEIRPFFLVMTGVVLALNNDIKQRAQHSLQHIEERYRALFQDSRNMVFLHDFAGNFIDANDAALALLGHTRKDISRLNFVELIKAEQLPQALMVLEELKATGTQARPTAFTLYARDGSVRHVETMSSVINRGHPCSIVQGIARDITEQVMSMEATRETEMRYRSLFEQSNDGVFIMNLDNGYQHANQRLANMLGYTVEEISHINVEDIILPEQIEHSRQMMQRLRAGEKLPPYERTLIRKDGSLLTVEINIEMVYDDAGRPSHFQSITRDISERRRIEDELRDSEAYNQQVFDNAPIAIFEQDLSRMRQHLKQLQADGITDLRAYLTANPQAIVTCLSHIDVTNVNEEAVRLYGAQTKAELIAHFSRLPGPDLSQVESLVAIASGQTSFTGEFADQTLSGETITVLVRWVVLPGYEDSFAKVLISTVDITERTRIQDELRRSEELLHQTGAMARVGGWEIDLNINQVYWTDVTRQIHEVPDDYVPPLDEAINFFHPKDRPTLEAAVRSAIEDGQPFDLELRLITATGKTLWTHAIGTAEQKNGQVVRVYGTFQDIDERKRMERQLRRSERQMRHILETQTELVTRYRPDTTITFANEAYLRAFNVTREEAIGHSLLNRRPAADHDYIRQYIQDFVDSGEDFCQVEYALQQPDGSVRWYMWFDQLFRDEAGNPVEIQAVGRDITDLKRVEQALRESEHRYRIVADLNTNWTFWQKADGSLEYVSPACEPITGFAPQEMRDDPDLIDRLILEDDRAIWDDHLHASPAEDGTRQVEVRIRHRDGSIRWLDHICRPVIGNDGQFDGFHVSNQDITERREAEAALRHSEARQKTLLSAIPDAIIHANREGRFLDYHVSNLDKVVLNLSPLVGHIPEEAPLSVNVPQTMVIELGALHRLNIEQALDTGEEATFEFSLPLENGTSYEYEARTVASGDDEVLTIIRNITDRKQFEQQQMTLALEKERLRMLTQFIRGAAHEFRTPLTIINSSASLLSKTEEPEKRRHRVKQIEQQVFGIAQLVDRLLQMSKLEAISTLNHRPVNVSTLLASIVSEISFGKDSGPDVHLEHQPDLPPAAGDAQQLQDAFYHVIENAYRLTPHDGCIRVSTAATSEHIVVEVEDTGPGIPPEHLDKIFETFWRQDMEARTTPGFGLGLSIAQKIIHLHNGHIEVESEVGKGSLFRITLPKSQA